jgi:hypothetical protein
MNTTSGTWKREEHQPPFSISPKTEPSKSKHKETSDRPKWKEILYKDKDWETVPD